MKHDARTCKNRRCSKCSLDERIATAYLRGFGDGIQAEREGRIPRTYHHAADRATPETAEECEESQ